MAQTFSVNGKEYLPSNLLAGDFGYSTDYIARLAREEKILGTQVGRQWFVERESLKTFLHKVNIQKEIRKEELRLERKAEQVTTAKLIQNSSESKLPDSRIALAQSFAVVLCGVLVGSLGWTMVVSELSLGELTEGSKESLALIGNALLPVTLNNDTEVSVFEELQPETSVAASAEGIPLQKVPTPVFTVLPVFPPRVTSAQLATSTLITQLQESGIVFSDEIEVVVDENGKEYIIPIFKKRSTSTVLYSITPVKGNPN